MRTFARQSGKICLAAWLALSAVAQAADDAGELRDALAVERERAPAPRYERAAALVRPTVSEVTLSPDGRRVAYFREQGKDRGLWLQPVDGGALRRLLPNTSASSLYWSRDGRWLLLESDRQLFSVAADGQAGSGIVSTLGGPHSRELSAMDSVFPAAVLLTEKVVAAQSKMVRWQLLRVDLSGRRSLLFSSAMRITGFAFDPRGRLAFIGLADKSGMTVRRVDATGATRVLVTCVKLARCTLLGTRGDGTELLLRSDVGGSLNRLVRLDTAGRMHTLHVDPRGEADLDEIVLTPRDGQPLIASYRSTRPVNYGLNADAGRHVDAINAHFPRRNLRLQVGQGPGAQWLVAERDATMRGTRLHLYDPGTGAVRTLMDDAPVALRGGRAPPLLPASALARKIPFAYRASDGMRLHGFLLVPPGLDPSRLPLVANVHGGPWNHARPEYGTVSQLLVNRGYVVFEPNFRGSTGHGRDYLLAARGDLGNGRVQQDIVDGVRYLLSQHVGQSQRVGIVGASFGGYSALLGVTFQPELFRVGVAMVPPPDFAWDLRWVSRSRESLSLSRYLPFADLLRLLSLDLDDPRVVARLHAQSPLANASRVQRPLLLVAGGEDRKVGISGVVEYAARLKLLRKDVSLLIDPDAGHSDHQPLAREANLYLLERMLHRHLHGARPTPPSAELRAYLQRNLRIDGDGLDALPD